MKLKEEAGKFLKLSKSSKVLKFDADLTAIYEKMSTQGIQDLTLNELEKLYNTAIAMNQEFVTKNITLIDKIYSEKLKSENDDETKITSSFGKK